MVVSSVGGGEVADGAILNVVVCPCSCRNQVVVGMINILNRRNSGIGRDGGVKKREIALGFID